MDYLDPNKETRHRLILYTGYVLIGVAVVIASLILLYQAYGFGLGKNGTVIQNGLAFISSHPSPAKIDIEGVKKTYNTNTRVVLPAGIYKVKLSRAGYRDWQRTINLEGGSVQHYDYPFLFPKDLTANNLKTFAVQPGFSTQSPDRRWLLIQPEANPNNFLVYDLKNPAKAPLSLSLPENLLSKANGTQSWLLGEWADDGRHVLLQHTFDGSQEFILVDRVEPAGSVNLNVALKANPTKLTLRDKKYDKYYLYDAASLPPLA